MKHIRGWWQVACKSTFGVVLAVFSLCAQAQLCREYDASKHDPKAVPSSEAKTLDDWVAIVQRCAAGAKSALNDVKGGLKAPDDPNDLTAGINGPKRADENARRARDAAVEYWVDAEEANLAAVSMAKDRKDQRKKDESKSEADAKREDEEDAKALVAIKEQLMSTAKLTHAAKDLVSPEKLEVFPFVGFAVDTFAASEVQSYLNLQDSGNSKTRETFGIWFQYPLFTSVRERFGLSVYGQTLHGVRSTEFDCKYDQPLLLNPKCKDIPASERPATPADPADTALYILRSASSLEAMAGLRFDFWNLQNRNANLYVSRQLGFVSVANSSGDVADVNHTAIGARINDGRFRNSFVEVGRGTNDLFSTNSGNRTKINARIVARLGDETSTKLTPFRRSYFFAHIAADVDGGPGADAVQTYIGIAFCPWGSGRCAGGY